LRCFAAALRTRLQLARDVQHAGGVDQQVAAAEALLDELSRVRNGGFVCDVQAQHGQPLLAVMRQQLLQLHRARRVATRGDDAAA